MDEKEILDRITPRFATREEAYDWYESVPVPGFGGMTARELVAQGRAQEVVAFLAACDAGVYA